jgi:hypothetical protein
VMTLRAFHLRTRCPRSSVKSRLAPTQVVSACYEARTSGVALIKARHLCDTAYVGARRPCTAFMGRRIRKSNARNAIAQAFIA